MVLEKTCSLLQNLLQEAENNIPEETLKSIVWDAKSGIRKANSSLQEHSCPSRNSDHQNITELEASQKEDSQDLSAPPVN